MRGLQESVWTFSPRLIEACLGLKIGFRGKSSSYPKNLSWARRSPMYPPYVFRVNPQSPHTAFGDSQVRAWKYLIALSLMPTVCPF